MMPGSAESQELCCQPRFDDFQSSDSLIPEGDRYGMGTEGLVSSFCFQRSPEVRKNSWWLLPGLPKQRAQDSVRDWLTESHTLPQSKPLPCKCYFYSIFFMFSVISSVVAISSFPLHECEVFIFGQEDSHLLP